MNSQITEKPKNSRQNIGGIPFELDLILDALPIVLFSCDTSSNKYVFYKGEGIIKSLKRHEPQYLFNLNNLISGAINFRKDGPEIQTRKTIKVGDEGDFLLSYTIVKKENDGIKGVYGYFIDQSQLQGGFADKFVESFQDSPLKQEFDDIRTNVYESYNEKLVTSFHQTLESEIAIKVSKLILDNPTVNKRKK